MSLDGISAHCPFWVHTTAWTESPTVRPFLPPEVANKSAAEIEKWSETYILRLLDLAAALGRQDRADVLGRGVRLGTGHRLSVGILEGRRLRSGARGQGAVCQEDGQNPRARQQARHFPGPRNSSRHRRDVRGRFQHAGANVRRRQMPDGQRRSVALLGGGKLGNPLPQSGPAHLRLPRQELCHPPRPALAHDGRRPGRSGPCSSWTFPPAN